VAARIAADQARLVELAVRVEELKGSLTARFPGTWMGWQSGMSNGEVRRVRLLAEKLPTLPGIRSAFAAGQVSEATALAMSRVATPDNESELLALADTATGVRGAQFATALQAMLDQLRDASPDADVTRADALVAMALSALDATRRGDGTLADRYLISIQVDAEGAHIPGHGPMSMQQLKALLPEALVSLLIAENAIPTTVTSPKRLATREQRITLGWRDRTCRFPGCGRIGRLRAHHLRMSTRGGPTQIRNLLYVCDTHHTEIHQHDYEMILERDGTLVVTRHGVRIPNRHTRPPPGVAPPRPPRPRLTGTGEPLTHYASSVTIERWLTTLAA